MYRFEVATLKSSLPCRLYAHLESSQAILAGILLAGCATEAALVFGWLQALSLADHPGMYGASQNTLVWALGNGGIQLIHFMLLLLSLFVPYLLVLGLAGRGDSQVLRWVAFAGAFVFGVSMLFIFPAGTTDIFHNVIDGRIFWIHHLNPLVTPPTSVSDDPFYHYITHWANIPAMYGPLWYILTGPATFFAGTDRDRALIAFKAIPFAFELISLCLVAILARRVDPRRTAAAVICFGWNPLVLWEVAGNGHNDVVMMAFVLLALVLITSKRWPLAFMALACSVLVKYVSVILFPIFVVWTLRRHGRRAALPLAVGLLGAGVVAVVIFAPFWSGASTFAQLHAQQNRAISSIAAALIGRTGDGLANTPWRTAVKGSLIAAFTVAYALTLLRIKSSTLGIVAISVEALFAFIVLMVWWFFPWYAIWPLALAAVLPTSAQGRLAVLFSATTLFAYCIAWEPAVPLLLPFIIPAGTALFIFYLPVRYAMRHIWRRDALQFANGRLSA